MGSKYFVEGKSLRQIADASGVSYYTVLDRYRKGERTIAGLSKEQKKDINFRIECATDKGGRLLTMIRDNNLTIRQVVERSGVSRSAIWNFTQNGANMPSFDLARVCAAAGASMDYVMGLKNEK